MLEMSSNNPIWRNTVFALAAVLFLIALRFSSALARVEPAGELRVERPLMGTNWSIEVIDEGRASEGRRAIDRAYTELERIDRLMSEWKPESPVSYINDNAGKQPVEVPQELRELIERSIRYSTECQGTFDITWRGMGRIWHFDDAFVPPTAAVVAEARKNVDYRRIQVDGDRILLRNKGMNIGLGGIAKGYAIDRAAQVLVQAGFHNWLVDGGGDVLSPAPATVSPGVSEFSTRAPGHGKMLGMVELSKEPWSPPAIMSGSAS